MRSAALILLVGCDVGARVAAPFPDLGDARSIVIAIRSEDGIEVEAHDRDEAPIRLVTSESAVVEILAYAETLESLDLEEGSLPPQEDGDSLPMPQLIYEASVKDDALSVWQEKREMSSELADFKVPRPPSQCTRYEIVAQADVPFTYTSLVFDGRMYIGGPSGLSRLSMSGAEKVTLDPELNVRGMALDPAGAVWLSTETGAFWRGDVSFAAPQLEQVFTTTSGDTMTWVGAGPNEVFSLSQVGVVERFDGTRSRVIYRFPRTHTLGAGLAYVGEGEVVAVHQLIGTAVRYRDQTITEDRIGDAELLYFNAAAQVPGIGTVIGSEEGRFFASSGDGWTDLGDSMFSLRVLSILPTEAGFLWGGEFGALGEYRRDTGFCPSEIVHGHDVWHLREVGGLIYVVNRGDQGIASMTVLRGR